MNSFYNPNNDVADDAIDGLIQYRKGTLRRYARDTQTRIVVRSNLDKSKVAVISGGGAGHEPLHAGLVGEGMLSGAVSGGVFASPSADAILTTIKLCAEPGGAGVLVIVKNYTGDTLNFGLAAVQARTLNIAVETVVVKDDVSLGDERPRGIAGTAMVHKVAGYYADRGETLGTVAEMAQTAANNLCSIGVSRTSCLIPGVQNVERIGEESVEIGIGIHGERGVETCKLSSAKEIMTKLCERMEEHVDYNSKYGVLFNNLGGLSVLESMLLYNELTKQKIFSVIDYIAGPSCLVTSLDMAGLSLSFIKLDDFITEALTQPISLREWPVFEKVHTEAPVPLPQISLRVQPQPSNNVAIRKLFECVLNALIDEEPKLNLLDSHSGDGDTGITVSRAAKKVLSVLDTMPFNNPDELFAHIGVLASQTGGTLGGIVGILLGETARTLPNDITWDSGNSVFGVALLNGLNKVCEALASKPGDRTIIDALHPAVECLKNAATINEAAIAARAGAMNTSSMKANVGRAAYVPDDAIRGLVDPGAEAAAIVFEALAMSREQ